MCIVSDTLVHEKPNAPATQIGEWNEFTTNALRQMWADGIAGAEIGRRLGFSKSAIHGKVDRLELTHRERGKIGNAVISPEIVETINRLHMAGKTIMEIRAVVGICRTRIARVIGPQGSRGKSRISVKRITAPKISRPFPAPARVINLHTLDETDDLSDTIREVRKYLRRPRAVIAPIPPRSARQCEAVDGPRYKQVQCAGIRDDLRSPYCPECKSKFHVARAA